MQLASKESTAREEGINSQVQILAKEKAEKGYIELGGFWDSSFERDIRQFSVGDRLLINVDDVRARTGALIAKDESGKSVGVITNFLALNYSEFVTAIIRHVGKSKFHIKITEIEKNKSSEGRHYFKAKIVDYAFTDTT